jgi:uroporphyrinogen-III synthase
MQILVTRPEADAGPLKDGLEARGHRVTLAPLLEPRVLPIDLPADAVQATIVTSRNALRAIAGQPALSALRQLPIFAVGPATGKLAVELGFSTVFEGPAGGRELAELIAAHVRPDRGPLLYLAGNTVAFDIQAALKDCGIACHRAVSYEMVEATQLPDNVRDDLAVGAVDAVILMSPRTSAVFSRLVAAAGLHERCRGMLYLCLSKAVAMPLYPLSPERIKVANLPNSEEMLALIDQISSTSD